MKLGKIWAMGVRGEGGGKYHILQNLVEDGTLPRPEEWMLLGRVQSSDGVPRVGF